MTAAPPLTAAPINDAKQCRELTVKFNFSINNNTTLLPDNLLVFVTKEDDQGLILITNNRKGQTKSVPDVIGRCLDH